MFTLLCPKCGRIRKADDIENKICKYCLGDTKAPVEQKELTICKICARMKIRNKWTPFCEDELSEIIKDYILEKDNITNIETEFKKDKIIFYITKESKKNRDELVVSPRFIICDDCYKNMSDYFQAVVQIRYTKNLLKNSDYAKIIGKKNIERFFIDMMVKLIKDMRKDGDYAAHLQKILEDRNGFDMYVGSKTQAIKYIQRIKELFDIERKDSKTMVGINKKGHEKLRYTYLVRIKDGQDDEYKER